MITEADLKQAIAECQAERNPNAHTAVKLAAFYTLLDHLEPEKPAPSLPAYSFAAGPEEKRDIYYDSGTDFSQAIYGRKPEDIWPIFDELMDVLINLHPRLYNAVLRKIEKL